MSILGALFSGPEIIEGIISIIEKHVTDPSVMSEIKAQITALEIPEDSKQADIEAAEEKSDRTYMWACRATVEWICIFGLLCAVVINPMMGALGFPQLLVPTNLVLNLLYGLLGMGATHIAENLLLPVRKTV